MAATVTVIETMTMITANPAAAFHAAAAAATLLLILLLLPPSLAATVQTLSATAATL